MKRAIVMSVLGAAACLVANRVAAQGTVIFSNYNQTGGTAAVTYAGAASGGFTAGETIGTGFIADLLYSLNGTSYTDGGITTSFLAPSNTPLASGGGLFGSLSTSVSIPGYSGGNVWFQVEVYNGSSYALSSIKGTSGVVELNTLATAANQLPTKGLLSDNGAAITPLAAFTVTGVPEPTTMALGGLGLAALLVARRKKA